MGKTLFQKTAAFTVAVVTACCGFSQTGLSALAASVQQKHTSAAEIRQTGIDPVSVMIALNSDAILDGNESPEYLATADAAAESDAVRRSQDAVIAQIREWYPELAVRYRYTTLVNGFACSLPANLLGKVSELPEVESVTQTGKLKVKQEMASAATLGNIPYFHNESGCSGEGQVIAVIDSEIDVTHPMFAPLADDLQKKISKSDLDAIASGVGFNTSFETDKAYISSKVPFAIDYSEDPYAIANSDKYVYHGTHVCGIAAGNRITDAEGVAMSGVAPDAQIVFLGMENAVFNLEEVLLAAIEDAVKLNVDAINMSLGIDGDPMGESFLAEAVNQAEAAGITVCIAAGNSDNGTSQYGETHYADNPDVSWMNGFISEGTNALAVASADNPAMAEYYCFTVNGQPVPYECYYNGNEMDWPEYLFKSLDLDQDYEYVYCGLGREEDFTDSTDLTGKIALIDRGENYFSVKAANARMHGAVAAIIVQNTDEAPIIMNSDDPLPLGMITKENGELLKNAENKVIRFTDSTTRLQRETGVSSYSSWGIHSSMELRPDIMAIGGNVTSAAYNNELYTMSGTSMASPYMAGCAAILKQYLLQNGCTLSGSELSRYMRNLLMTTALPYRKNNMYVTPRRQGAGLVQMDAAIKSKVILTGAEGESKLSLRDRLGTQFSFPLTLTNISYEDVSFTDARIELTTDDAQYDNKVKRYKINGQQPLSCTASLDSLKQIAAGESRTETVTVSLDAAQCEELKNIFSNGFFIEGYLVLEGAENSTDISIPLVGFSDNFAQIPAFTDNIKSLALTNNWTATPNNIPFCESVDILMQALNRAENFDSNQLNIMLSTAYENVNEDELERLNQKPEVLYCSPNHDGLADMVALYPSVQRHCLISGMQLLDQNGKIVADGLHNQFMSKDPEYFIPPLTIASLKEELKEGMYTVRLSASIYSDPSEDEIQVLDYPLCVDQTKPVITTEKKTQNGKTTVSVTATDESALDGVIVLGKGEGHVAGKKTQRGNLPKKTTIDLAQNFMSYQGYDMYESPYYDQKKADEYTFIDMEQLPPFMQYLADFSTEENYQYIKNYMSDYDFAEFIPVSGSSKELTFEYDVTDLSTYEFLTIDRAFNVCDEADINEQVRPNSIQPGVYQTDDGIYVITEDTIHFIASMWNVETTYHYTVSNGVLTLIGDLDDSIEQGENKLYVKNMEDGSIRLRALYAFDELFGTVFYDNIYERILVPVDIEDPEHYYAIPGIELEVHYLEPYVRSITGHKGIITSYYTFRPDGVVVFNMQCFDDDMNEQTIPITVDLKTGIGTLEDGTTIDFLNTFSAKTGDVDCSGSVDVADAVLLARLLAEDQDAYVSEHGKINADVDGDGTRSQNDVVMILRAIARLITLY